MDPDIEFDSKAEQPSLRSEFGGGGNLPEDALLRFGPVGAAPVPDGEARTYAFTRSREQAPGAPEVPVTPQAVPTPQPQAAPAYPPQPQAAYVPQPQGVPGASQPQGAVFAPQAAGAASQPVYAQPGVQAVYVPIQAVPVAGQIPIQVPGYVPVPQPAAPTARSSASGKRACGSVWLWVAVIAALVLGLVVGAFGYRLWMDHRDSSADPGTSQQPGSKGDQGDAAGIYDANAASVVSVFVSGSDAAAGSEMTNAGTGFVLSADGYLLTNYHVIREAAAVVVTLQDGRQLPARLVEVERESSDLALLKVEATDLRPVELGDSSALRTGDWICTIGNPFGELERSLTVGYVSAGVRSVESDGRSISMLQINASLNAGNSGGPLFDAGGRVVGVVTAKYTGGSPGGPSVEGLGFVIPINDAKTLAEAWIQADRQ